MMYHGRALRSHPLRDAILCALATLGLLVEAAVILLLTEWAWGP
jgi:hypothetical protein